MTTRTPKPRVGPSPPALALWLVGTAIALGTARPAAAGPDPAKLIVVIYPGESDTAPGIIQINQALRATFARESAGYVEVRNEYVDTNRLDEADFMTAQVALLKKKYSGRKVDLVIAGLSSGLDFALRYRDDLFPGIPVVFMAVDEREVVARRLPPDVIGTPIRMDLTGTLNLALRFHPDARQVFVIAGSSTFDHEWVAEARRRFQPYDRQVEFVYLTGLPMDELLGRVADLPARSIVYFLHMQRDGAGRPTFSAEALDQLAARANAPVYGHINTYVGRGAVGGRVFSFETEGTNAARLALRVLAGAKPGAMTVPAAGDNISMFDWRQLQKWGIDDRDLPPGSVVRFKEATFWDTYRRHVIGIATVCAIQTLLIVGLLIQRTWRRRAEVAARESEARFERMADAAPVLIWASGPDKGGTYFNRPWLEFTGRTLQQERGEGWTDGVHPDDRARCLRACGAHFDAREPFEMVFRLRRHDGEYRWVLDRGIPRVSPDGEFAGYVGACTDVTARRQAEEDLLTSRQDLRLLTGRLLEAHEEERRRIARELHDDLNQRLALLCVELDLLGQRPPASSGETARRLRLISGRVKELSSAVHDLSHQLHPSKLEHLGLVDAVGALCREMTRHHGLDVGFTHGEIPGALPGAVTLCLYRITQEALRNVVKHSGSDYAAVELSGGPGRLRLQVSDAGAGFDPAAAGGAGGLGLVSIRERLYAVGGRVVIDSRPGGGTRIQVCVPVADPAESADGAAAPSPCEAELVSAGTATEASA